MKSPLCILCFFLFFQCAIHAIENSIVPVIDRYEELGNLSPQKYSYPQFLEILAALQKHKEKLRIVTYNVLSNRYDENLEEVNHWSQRLPRIVGLIEEMDPDILGVQELYPDQLKELHAYLRGAYAFYGKPCVDGEINGIFFRKNRFLVQDRQVWYLDENPKDPSTETLTMLKLKDLITGKLLAIFNTHLAMQPIEKRELEARLISEHIQKHASHLPIILTGDLNTFPNRPDLIDLPFYDGDYILSILKGKKFLNDAKDISLLGHLGPLATFTSNGKDSTPFKGIGLPGVFLDHIMVSNDIQVWVHAVQAGTVEGHFPSDHMPVIADIVVE
ncbi:endonuclease/exonuclease/phosphatase family protein [Parachlamydia acanthamoebae]|uniref:endonuclease/exonuclease/phosphatase family protein n=1 Tax=Parachlamydia acanthamoebae TaxID=83552 RepID=UPI0007508975|nr:endonuclease/exonuclease/phosphatase family protein [Parachlamydia acanthamoebae]